MSTGVVESQSTLPDTVYVVTKKLGIEPRKQIAVQDPDTARQWLRDEIVHDLAMSKSFHWKEYNKTVAESPKGDVYGHIEEVPTLQHDTDEKSVGERMVEAHEKHAE